MTTTTLPSPSRSTIETECLFVDHHYHYSLLPRVKRETEPLLITATTTLPSHLKRETGVQPEDDVGGDGTVLVELSSSGYIYACSHVMMMMINVNFLAPRVGHLRFTLKPSSPSSVPSLLFEVTCPSAITSTPENITGT
jgi:hypothetical protein